MVKLKKTKFDRIFDIFIYSAALFVLFITLYPLIYIVSASFSDPMAVAQGRMWFLPVRINTEAYRMVVENSRLWLGYRNTIIYVVVGTSINVAMTIAAAYPLSRRDFRGRKLITFIFAFTMFFSGGLIPTYLLVRGLGITDTIWAMVIPNAVAMWNIIITRTFFQSSIPHDLQEAAFIDGASNILILFRVVLPLSKAIIAVIALFYAVGHWNAFFNALIYLNDADKYPLQIILRDILIINQIDMTIMDYESYIDRLMLVEGIKYASIVVASLPIILLYIFLQKYFVHGVMIGSIKG